MVAPALQALLDKISARNARVGVIGLGYVGLPLLAAFHDAGLPVIGFDTDPAKIESLKAGKNYLKHLGDELTRPLAGSPRFDATTDLSRLGECDAVISCVPTPLGKHLEPDLSFVQNSAAAIAAASRPGQLVVLESSTYPRTTREIFLPPLTARGRTLGQDVFIAYSPEREDPGRHDHTTRTIPKLVGGLDEASTTAAVALYGVAVQQIVPVRTAEVAEAAKLLENIYRAVNIALVNEMKLVLTAMDIDVWEVIAAASTKPFGFQAFYPGPGLGGHCIPIDPYYLTWKAREVGMPTRFIELAGEVNHAMPQWVIGRVTHALNDRGRAVKGSRVLVLGLAYKPDVDDVRESPSFELIEGLQALGAAVDYHDPHVAKTHTMRKYNLNMASVGLTEESLAHYDCVLVSTAHSAIDWQMVGQHARLIIDTRNALKNYSGDRSHIVMA